MGSVEWQPMTSAFNFKAVNTSVGVTFEPWTDGWAVGFKCTHKTGEVEFIYLNPSGESGAPADVFLYQGVKGDPAEDESMTFFGIDMAKDYSAHCDECGEWFDDNLGSTSCKTCADWYVTPRDDNYSDYPGDEEYTEELG